MKSLEMMEEKQARSLVVIEASNWETKDTIQNLTQQVSAQGEAVEFAHGRIDDMEQDLEAFKNNVYGGVKRVIKNHNKLIRTVTRRDDLIKEMKAKITALETKAAHTEMVLKEGGIEQKDFHPDYMVVIENLPYMKPDGEEETDEDLCEDARYIFGKCMRIDVEVVRVKRMSIQRNNTGLVKFELASEAMVEKVLKNKTKLREADNHPEIQSLWVHKSKTMERLVKEHNSDVLLQELNLTEKYRCMPNGRLVLNRGRQGYNSRGRQGFQDHRDDHRRGRVYSQPEGHTKQNRDSYSRWSDAVTDHQPEGRTKQNRDSYGRWSDSVTDHSVSTMTHHIGPGTAMLVQSVVEGTPMTMATTGTTDGSQEKQTTPGPAKAAETPWCLTKRCIDSNWRTRVRKTLEGCGRELG